MAATFQDFFQFLDQLADTLAKLTDITRAKTQAVRRDDLLKVNECMKQEQAYSLSLRNFDRKREKMLAELGLSAVPLLQFTDHCPEDLRLQAKKKVENLQNHFKIYQTAADAARTVLECNLHEIEKHMGEDAIAESKAPHIGSLADIRA